ncbi:MAG: hypothetical protein JO257_10035 [Deltaproteobacteria bacterium]|nr:hypothetical protein [Deltaproteobacteria bacterium]
MLVEIAYRGADRASDADAIDYRFDVLDWRTQDHIRVAVIRVEDITRTRLSNKYGRGDEKKGRPLFERAVFVAGLRRFESVGASLIDTPDVPLLEKLDYDEIDAAGNESKQCAHQQRRGADLFCLAAERGPANDDIPTERRASTTQHACNKLCALPDKSLLCSNFVHLQIVMAAAYPPAPIVGPRVCEVGNQPKIEVQPIACIPGGHDCWRRVFDLGKPAEDVPLHPLALNEALDFLSWVWRAKFPASQTKLIHLASATSAAEVVLPCETVEAFRSRMNALADLLDSLKVDASLTSSPGQVNGTLNRLQHTLRTHLPQAEFERADVAIAIVRNAVDLRNALHHTDAGRKAPAAARKLGLDWPPLDWTRAWARVRDSVARAVRELRQAIETTI